MFAWLILGALALVALTALVVFNLLKDRRETAEARVWANYDEPLFFIQSAYGTWFAQETTAQYERALELLKKHGNKLLDKENDIHLWVHRATVHNPKLDFKEWREQCRVDERKYKEEFDLKKAAQALAKNQVLLNAARLTTERLPLEKQDFERNQNGTHE